MMFASVLHLAQYGFLMRTLYLSALWDDPLVGMDWWDDVEVIPE